MLTTMVRLLVVTGLALSSWFAVSADASAAPTDPATTAAVVSTQAFTGGGGGTYSGWREQLDYDGNYTSNGQLGNGHIHFGNGLTDTAVTLTRADGMAMHGQLEWVNVCGAVVPGNCMRSTLTGTGDVASASIIFATQVETTVNDPAFSGRFQFLMHGTLTPNHRYGYLMLGANGTAYSFGGLSNLGSAPTIGATDIESTPTHLGYWIVDSRGHVFTFGDAPYLGGANPATLTRGESVTSMSATPTGKGYWLFTARGRVLRFGDAKSFGDLTSIPLQGGIVGSIATPTGNGYYMVGRDGGVFAFGDARFRGSMGNVHLNQPVVGLVPTPGNTGYWLVAADGGVFSFDAPFRGSLGGLRLNQPINTMVRYGDAYLMVAADGGVFNFAHAPFFGSLGGTRLPAPIVNAAAAG